MRLIKAWLAVALSLVLPGWCAADAVCRLTGAGPAVETLAALSGSGTGLVYGDIFLRHATGPGHPEQPARLTAIMDGLAARGLLEKLVLLEPVRASREHVLRVHPAAYLEAFRAASAEGAGIFQSRDTPLSGDTWETALFAAGGVLRAVDAVMQGRVRNAFCAVRPPGHHATRSRAMGFCFLNHVAIGALHLIEHHGLERIAIVNMEE